MTKPTYAVELDASQLWWTLRVLKARIDKLGKLPSVYEGRNCKQREEFNALIEIVNKLDARLDEHNAKIVAQLRQMNEEATQRYRIGDGTICKNVHEARRYADGIAKRTGVVLSVELMKEGE